MHCKPQLNKPVFYKLLFWMAGTVLLWSCKKGELLPNIPPDTHISIDTIALSGPNRLSTEVKLSWYGTDEDGFVTGFEISFDKTTWFYTAKQDSNFKFSIDPNSDSSDIQFYVRAIDNNGLADIDPDHLRIPIRNTPPVATLDDKSFPEDSTLLVTTFRWSFSDIDGASTVKKAFIKINAGNWVEIDRSKIILSILPEKPEVAGSGNALIYYDNQTKPAAEKVDGFINNGLNTFYIKVVDQSGAESKADTSKTVFVKRKTSDLLVLGGQPTPVNAKYKSLIQSVYTQGFDYLDLTIGSGKNQPKFWSPTFNLTINSYSKIFVNTDQSSFTHPNTGITLTLLEFMAPSFQQFNNAGGKSFITTSFQNKADISGLRGAYTIDSVSKSNGQAVISSDSNIYSTDASYPVLSPSNLLLGCDPHQFAPDAESFYKAKLTSFSGWSGPNTVGSRRMSGGRVKQVFFSVELHLFDKDAAALKKLFDTVLNKDLN